MGTLGSLSEPLLCGTFFFFSCNLIDLDGWAQGPLWRRPPVAVVWPELSDFLPAITDLVPLSTATAAVTSSLWSPTWWVEAGSITGVELNHKYWSSWLFSNLFFFFLPLYLFYCKWLHSNFLDLFLCTEKNPKLQSRSFLKKNWKPGKNIASEEDEAEETGDGVWRGHILCGCVLTLSDVGSSPTWPCTATERRELSTGKSNDPFCSFYYSTFVLILFYCFFSSDILQALSHDKKHSCL